MTGVRKLGGGLHPPSEAPQTGCAGETGARNRNTNRSPLISRGARFPTDPSPPLGAPRTRFGPPRRLSPRRVCLSGRLVRGRAVLGKLTEKAGDAPQTAVRREFADVDSRHDHG